MTSDCCKNVVRLEFEKHHLTCQSIELGKIDILENISDNQLTEIKKTLEKNNNLMLQKYNQWKI